MNGVDCGTGCHAAAHGVQVPRLNAGVHVPAGANEHFAHQHEHALWALLAGLLAWVVWVCQTAHHPTTAFARWCRIGRLRVRFAITLPSSGTQGSGTASGSVPLPAEGWRNRTRNKVGLARAKSR